MSGFSFFIYSISLLSLKEIGCRTEIFNSLAKSEGIEVYDATIDGKCNIFKKLDISEVYK